MGGQLNLKTGREIKRSKKQESSESVGGGSSCYTGSWRSRWPSVNPGGRNAESFEFCRFRWWIMSSCDQSREGEKVALQSFARHTRFTECLWLRVVLGAVKRISKFLTTVNVVVCPDFWTLSWINVINGKFCKASALATSLMCNLVVLLFLFKPMAGYVPVNLINFAYLSTAGPFWSNGGISCWWFL